MKKLKIFTFTIIGAIILILIIGKINANIQFKNQIKTLFGQLKNISNQKFEYAQILGLPAPVQLYFKHVLNEGQPYISSIRMKHDGQFKTGLDKDWINIKGEHYATANKPGFIWKGSTTIFTAKDSYLEDKGRLEVSIFSLIRVVDGKGIQYDQGELIRWLGESVLYPTNLLPSNRLMWLPIDSNTAMLTYNYNGLSLFFKVSFDPKGEITELETKRYMDLKNLETWIIKLANYERVNNIVIPTSFEVLWRLEKQDLSYAKFNITEIEYDKTELF